MLITFKTLQQKIFKIEAEPADSVADLKAKVAAERGEEFPADVQKLIYNGKVLEDAKTLQECGVNESGFVVVMAGKKPAATSTSAATSSKVAAATEQATSGSQQKVDTPAAAASVAVSSSATAASASTTAQPQPAVSAPAAAAAAPAPAGESALVTGADFEKTVNELIGMGFERSEVMVALRAAFNNPERAVEYLLNPESMPRHSAHAPTSPSGAHGTAQSQPPSQVPAGQATSGAAPTSAPSAGSGASSATASAADPLDEIARTPQFRQMRSVLQTNPNMLPTILEQIGRTNAPLLQLISANQDRFLQLLNAPDPEGAEEFEAEGAEEEEAAVGEQHAAPGGGRGPGTFIQVTPQEKEAIERLKGLGFPEHLVIQAYFACDKNEDAAANFLLSEQFDEDEFRG